jgi:hypothetical protein
MGVRTFLFAVDFTKPYPAWGLVRQPNRNSGSIRVRNGISTAKQKKPMRNAKKEQWRSIR